MLLGAGTAMVYPTLLAAIGDVGIERRALVVVEGELRSHRWRGGVAGLRCRPARRQPRLPRTKTWVTRNWLSAGRPW